MVETSGKVPGDGGRIGSIFREIYRKFINSFFHFLNGNVILFILYGNGVKYGQFMYKR